MPCHAAVVAVTRRWALIGCKRPTVHLPPAPDGVLRPTLRCWRQQARPLARGVSLNQAMTAQNSSTGVALRRCYSRYQGCQCGTECQEAMGGHAFCTRDPAGRCRVGINFHRRRTDRRSTPTNVTLGRRARPPQEAQSSGARRHRPSPSPAQPILVSPHSIGIPR